MLNFTEWLVQNHKDWLDKNQLLPNEESSQNKSEKEFSDVEKVKTNVVTEKK